MRPASSPDTPTAKRAVHVDGGHELRVDLTDQHHPDDVDGLAVGDAQAVAELALLAEPVHQVTDLRPAAVHDDRPHADLAHQHDVLGEQRQGVAVRCTGQRVAAVLDDDHLIRETANVRQRLDQRRRPIRAAESSRVQADRREAGGLRQAERDVGGLHGATGGTLGKVVDRTDGDDGVRTLVESSGDVRHVASHASPSSRATSDRTTTNGSPLYRPASVASNDAVVTLPLGLA